MLSEQNPLGKQSSVSWKTSNSRLVNVTYYMHKNSHNIEHTSYCQIKIPYFSKEVIS